MRSLHYNNLLLRNVASLFQDARAFGSSIHRQVFVQQLPPHRRADCRFALPRLSTVAVAFSSSSSSSSSSINDGVTVDATESRISSNRGRNAVKLLPKYLADARCVERYSPVTAPHGALQLGVAESQLLEDWLVPAMNEVRPTMTADCIYYQPTAGRESFRKSMARYLEQVLELPMNRLDPEGIIVGAGCNAVLENLCMCLAEPGHGILIPTPYYAAFEFDLSARAGLYVQPVTTQKYHCQNHDNGTTTELSPTNPKVYYPTTQALDAARGACLEAGHDPRILLLSHPHNPLGICYPPSVIQECIDWCRAREIHLISDEIYAGSVYRPKQAQFASTLQVADGKGNNESGLGPFVHFVYALSKDMALSGMRVGAAYSENTEIRLPFQKLNDLCQISSMTQMWTEALLTKQQQQQVGSSGGEELLTRALRKENHKRLEARCQALTTCLDECGISYLPPTAGLFVWLDLSEFLPPKDSNGGVAGGSSSDQERERILYTSLMKDFGLLLTPGMSMRNEKPGFMRCVFTAANDQEFALGLERIRLFVKTKKRTHIK